MKLRDTVYFDPQRNSYIRVNKDTGRQFKTYKSGQPKKAFKPYITGMDFKIRRNIQKQQNQSPYAVKSTKRKVKNIERLFLPRFNKTLDHQSPNQSIEMNSKKRLNISAVQSPRKIESILIQYNSTLAVSPRNKQTIFLSTITHSSVCEPNQSLNQSVVTIGKETDILGQTMKKFTNIQSAKRHQNNSPRKQQIDGNQPQKQYLQTMGLTMKDFKQPYISKYNRQNSRKLKIPTINERIPADYSPKQQRRRQGQTFYQFHPQYVFKQDQKSLEKQNDRRRNMKKLQQLFIGSNNKLTSKVYEGKQ